MARTVLVTGGGTGIGRAVAARFAADGDTVVITGRREGPLRAAADELGARAIVCDSSDPEQVAALVEQLPARLDVLVNNAGGNTDVGADEPTDLAGLADAWRANFAANVLTAVLTTEAVADRIADGGAVVHLSSIAADRGNGSYGAAKAAVASWNVGLARTLGERQIVTNVVSPGYIADTEFFGDLMTDERRSTLIGQTANGRAGRPEDIAATVHFLASPGGSHITGQVLNVNGGAWTTR